MGLFSSKSKINWACIESSERLKEIVDMSKDQVQVIFKHSTRCIISKMSKRRFEGEWTNEVVTPHLLDLIAYRSISNEISSTLNVMHQSPQILVIKDGEVVHHASHEGIDAKIVMAYLQ